MIFFNKINSFITSGSVRTSPDPKTIPPSFPSSPLQNTATPLPSLNESHDPAVMPESEWLQEAMLAAAVVVAMVTRPGASNGDDDGCIIGVASDHH